MKLNVNGGLDDLRKKMGADLKHWDSASWQETDKERLIKQLNTHEGIEIDFSELTIQDDSTFEWEGQKIIIYIRDQYVNRRNNSGYKFHISNCQTIREFVANKRINRYVISTNKDGFFVVNLIDGWSNSIQKDQKLKLNVCKNCLMELRYNGYNDHRRYANVYNGFSIEVFLEKYSTKITTKPSYTNLNAPLNDYTDDFTKISEEYRKLKNWKCEKCLVDLNNDHRYLHVHHINGEKSDNTYSNLKALCIKCHTGSPMHSHMKNHYDYNDFLTKYG